MWCLEVILQDKQWFSSSAPGMLYRPSILPNTTENWGCEQSILTQRSILCMYYHLRYRASPLMALAFKTRTHYHVSCIGIISHPMGCVNHWYRRTYDRSCLAQAVWNAYWALDSSWLNKQSLTWELEILGDCEQQALIPYHWLALRGLIRLVRDFPLTLSHMTSTAQNLQPLWNGWHISQQAAVENKDMWLMWASDCPSEVRR